MEQVCEWAQQLELDATSFHDYGITGAVLLGLSDDDMRVRSPWTCCLLPQAAELRPHPTWLFCRTCWA